MEQCTAIERSIIKKYRKVIWNRFIGGVKDYELIAEGDRIAVCISGGKDSMLLAKCMQELQRHSYMKFSLEFLVMDPGYAPENRAKIEANAELLGISVKIFNSGIFEAVEQAGDSPCYLCARMRRGYLYKFAQQLGCNKIALGHHFDDVIETVLMSMFYGAEIKTMMPKLHSTNFEGMELIRPLYLVREEDIIAWKNYNHLEFLQCACSRTAHRTETGTDGGKRSETKALLKTLKKNDPQIDINIFRSLHNVNIGALPGLVKNGEKQSFLAEYDRFDRKVDCAVFDVDGTLLDSMYIWWGIAGQYLRAHGINPPADVVAELRGHNVPEAVRWCNENCGLSVPVEEGVAEIIGMVRDEYADKVQAKPFVLDYIRQLKASGARVCAATNSEKAYLELALERLGILQELDLFVSASELGVTKKDPRFFELVAERLGTVPDKMTMFEDSLYAMKTAKAAGCRVVALYDEAAKEENDEVRKVCDFYAGSFAVFVK